MQVSSNLSEQEIKELQLKFYEYFETGYAFEEFLKEYLADIGLDEVEVTVRSRDGGVDLHAVRKGVGDFSEIDKTYYYIQAKRYKLTNKVDVHIIRELQGITPIGHKGVLITTSFCTKNAIEEAQNPQKPVVIIDGKSLIMSCIDREIGFLFKPVFSRKRLDFFCNGNNQDDDTSVSVEVTNRDYVEKTITANDIRARIVSVPSSIIKQFDESQTNCEVLVNNSKTYNFNINRGRNYFGSVTTFLRDYNMLSEDGVITPKQSKWFYDHNENKVLIYIEG